MVIKSLSLFLTAKCCLEKELSYHAKQTYESNRTKILSIKKEQARLRKQHFHLFHCSPDIGQHASKCAAHRTSPLHLPSLHNTAQTTYNQAFKPSISSLSQLLQERGTHPAEQNHAFCLAKPYLSRCKTIGLTTQNHTYCTTPDWPFSARSFFLNASQ